MASLTIMDINDYKKNALEFWDYYMDLYGIEPNFKTYVILQNSPHFRKTLLY